MLVQITNEVPENYMVQMADEVPEGYGADG